MRFRYRAVDPLRGTQVEGVIEAPSKLEALRSLYRRSLTVISCRKERSLFLDKLSFGRLKAEQQISFFSSLALMLKSGISVVSALDVLKEVSSSHSWRRFVEKVKHAVEAGSSFSHALGSSGLFPRSVVESVRAAEITGNLPEVLAAVAEDMQNDRKTRQKLKKASIYPIFVSVLLVVLIFVASNFMFPRVLGTIRQILAGRPLPPFTAKVVKIHEAFDKNRHLIPVVLGGMVFLGVFSLKVPRMREELEKVLLRVPALRDIIYYRNTLMFLRVLHLSMNAGLSSDKALAMASASLPSLVFRKRAQKARGVILSGGTISKAVYQVCRDPYLRTLVEAGERAGNLGDTFAELVRHYVDKAQEVTDRFVSFIEPLTIVGMGLVVALILLGVMVPLWESIQAVGAVR